MTKDNDLESWTREYETILRVDTNGNIVDDRIIKPNEQLVIKKGLTPKQIRLLQDKSDLVKYTEKLGGYIYMCYVKNQILFKELNIDRANISRLIYLSTYADYNNRQENLLVKYTQHRSIEPLTRADIKNILGLGETAFKSFMRDMKNNNLLYEVDKRFYISPEYFTKGKVSIRNKEYTRVYINTTRLLYEGCTSRQHKQLSYVYQLVPYVSRELNIICSNPHEMDFNKLDKLGLKQLCELLGLSTEKKSMNKFENDLLKLKINYNGSTHYLFKRVIVKGGNGKFDYFVINPQIIWSGNNTEKVNEAIQLCFFK